MDLWFIGGMIFLLIGVPFFIWATRSKPGPEPQRDDFGLGSWGDTEYQDALKVWRNHDAGFRGTRALASIVITLGLFLFGMSLWVQVPTNTIGIVTSFGKPVDAKPNGFQVKKPWEKVAKDLDASRQYLKFNGKGNDKAPAEDGKEFPCIQVKMEREAKGCINVVISWQMRAGTGAEREQAKELFKAHKTFDRLTENLMAANARSATTSVYDLVNPLVPEKNPTFSDLGLKLESNLRDLVGHEVTVISAQVVGADYDDETDKRIADMQAEYAKTEQAKQQKLTNEAISAANAALIAGGKLTPEILQDQCIKGAIAIGANPGLCLQPGWGGYGTAPQAPAK